MAWSLGNIWMETWSDGKKVTAVEDKEAGVGYSKWSWNLGRWLMENWKA